ncbi:MAG: YggS family pyridoxal phosphate-dependent enzyme [Actinomycetes bacterium]|jgi:PLP dependent protein
MSTRSRQILDNLAHVRERIRSAALSSGRSAEEITLVVVTKTYPISDIEILYEAGERHFGENRDQEGAVKAPAMPKDVHWHFQGQIQSNKIKSIVNWARTIHSLDNLVHARKISQATPPGESRELFLQVNLELTDSESEVAGHRGGIAADSLIDFANALREYKNLALLGVMAVAPLGVNPSPFFAQIFSLSKELQAQFPGAKYLSSGMSGDFEEAIAAGATHIRVGSSILGVRTPVL